jgi:hypothetical protein
MGLSYNSYGSAGKRHMSSAESAEKEDEESNFVEFRRKVRSAEVLSAAMERLLWSLHFTGRLSLVVQNGRVLKSGYEEGYFRQLGL